MSKKKAKSNKCRQLTRADVEALVDEALQCLLDRGDIITVQTDEGEKFMKVKEAE